MAANSSLPDHLAKSKTLVSLQGHSKKLQNPLEGVTREELADDAAVFAAKCDVESEEEKEIFVRAALLAAGLEDVAMDAAEVKAFGVEKQWWKVWLMSMFLLLTVLGNAMAAVVQGMDEYVDGFNRASKLRDLRRYAHLLEVSNKS